ncbi:MAG: galactose mutarotase [Clostridia bacterium]|nr:galactose mutarotase [Clostridia bacterium]
MTNIFEDLFGSVRGRAAKLYTLENGLLTVRVTDFGACVTDIIVPLPGGGSHNAVLGYPDASFYGRGSCFLGACVGRYAGRIGGAGFSLNGKTFSLAKNDGGNHLHGEWSKRFWEAETTADGVRFTLVSPDGDEGFPGKVKASVLYELSGGALRLTYETETDAPTFVNLTNHSYFNLGGATEKHLLTVHAERYAEVGPGLIPTGELPGVGGTTLDHRSARPVGEAISAPELTATRGLDHSFILEGKGLREAARLHSPETGLTLICRTTQPSVHVYTAGFLDGDAVGISRTGAPLARYGGVCLETQHLPDSPNKPSFPTTLLKPGEPLREVTEFRFIRE